MTLTSKEHRNQWNREYYDKNRDKYLKYGKSYYEQHKQEILVKRRVRYQKNRKEIIARVRASEKRNPHHYKKYNREYARKHADRINQRVREKRQLDKLQLENKKLRPAVVLAKAKIDALKIIRAEIRQQKAALIDRIHKLQREPLPRYYCGVG